MKKLFPFYSTATALLILTFAGCGGKKDSNDLGESHNVVYAVGSAMGSSPDVPPFYGVVWKDGKVLKQTNFMATFSAVYVTDGVVYAAGSTLADDRVFLWRSSDPNNYLYFDNGSITPRGVYGSGNNVYVVDERGKVWDANSGNIIHDLGDNVYISSVYASGTDVYSTGYTSADGYGTAAVWQGNQPINYGENFRGRFLGVHGSGNVIYAVGVRDGGNNDIYPVWQKLGGASGRLGNGRGLTKSVSVSGNNVYIAGVDESDDDNLIGAGIDVRGSGRVWKGTTDGTNFTPTISFGTNKSPQTVHTVGDSVYTLVFEINERTPSVFKVYKNDKPIHPFSFGEYPTRMFVVEAAQ
jgi:hypothetical protein